MGLFNPNCGTLLPLRDTDSVSFTARWLTILLGTSEYSHLIYKRLIDGAEVLRLVESYEQQVNHWLDRHLKEEHRFKLVGYFKQLRMQQNREVRRTTGIRFTMADDGQQSEIHLTPRSLPGPQPAETLCTCTVSNLSGVHSASNSTAQPTASSEWPTRDDIFRRGNRLEGKELLKTKYPSTLRTLEQCLRVIQSWLKNCDTDADIHAIVYRNYNEMPKMRQFCMDFIRSKLHELPTLVFLKTDAYGQVVSSYSMEWDEKTVYDYVMDRRKQIKSRLGPYSVFYSDSMSFVS
ncbi:hypothetical protein R1sor_001036 [Riccia sorocarpa]|uniref:Uncharacterized protein n=1 Tax=Riccia sorocarpa TaxID=122646 RepID=A0ABD3H0V2_9MARC